MQVAQPIDAPTTRWLLVDDDAAFARALHRLIGADQPATLAFSDSEAREALAVGTHWSGFFIDVHLGNASGLELLAFARAAHPTVPAAIVSGSSQHEVINQAFSLGAGFLSKPVVPAELTGFVARCLATSRRLAPSVAAVIEALARAQGLSRREVELLTLVVAGATRTALPRAMHISSNTVKTHTRSLLHKLDAHDVGAAVARILRVAIAHDHGAESGALALETG